MVVVVLLVVVQGLQVQLVVYPIVRSGPTRLTRVATLTKAGVRDKHNCLLSQSFFSPNCAQAEHG